MRLFFLYIIIFTLSVSAKETCSIEMSPQILFFKKPTAIKDIQNLVKGSSCSEEKLWTFIKMIQGIDGKVSSKHINRLLKEEGTKTEIQLRPNNIEILHLKNIVVNKVTLSEGLNILEVKVIDPVYAIGVNRLSEVKFECYACKTTGFKNLSIIFTNPVSGYRRNIWATIKISELKQVVVTTLDIFPFSRKALKDHVKLVELNLENSAQYIQSLSDLNFFKVNKYIKKDTLLKYSDLIAKDLVKTGKPTQVIMEQGGLKLQVEAIARQSGKYGEWVNLYNTSSKKQIRGQVIDFNKVRIDI